MTLKSRTTSVVIIGIVLVGLAVLIWADRTGRVTIFGSESGQSVTKTVESLEDWVKGKFDNSSYSATDGLKITGSQTTTNNTSGTAGGSTSGTAGGGAGGGTSGNSTNTTPPKLVSEMGGMETKLVTGSCGCKAVAPKDDSWSFTSTSCTPGSGATSGDLANSKKSLGASYLVTAVTVDPNYNFYKNQTPEQFIETIMTRLLSYTSFSWIGGPWDLGSDYQLKVFKAKKSGQLVKSLVQWRKWGTIGTSNYIIALRFAIFNSTSDGEWSKDDSNNAAITYNAVSSITGCTAYLGSSSSTTSYTESSRPKGSSDVVYDKISTGWSEAMLGYENAYDSATGQQYDAPLSAWNNTGPSGPGYYVQSGNDYHLLNLGFAPY